MMDEDLLKSSYDLIWNVLENVPEDSFKNGRTACFWHLVGVLNEHLGLLEDE